MNKEEAYDAMLAGHKITHEWFSPDEYLYIKKEDGKIWAEDGCCWGSRFGEGWASRQGTGWETGWSIYNN